MRKQFSILLVMVAVYCCGCQQSKLPPVPAPVPAPQPKAEEDPVLARLTAIESGLAAVVADVAELKKDHVEPTPEPEPTLDGYAETTRKGWAKYADLYADGIAEVIRGMKPNGKYDSIAKAVEGVAAASVKSRHDAMDPVVDEFKDLDFEEYKAKLQQYEDGIRWHSHPEH